MDPVVTAGLLASALLFGSGLGMVVFGLTRRVSRLPEGAELVLAAIAEGRLGPAAMTPVGPAGTPDATGVEPDTIGPDRRPVVPERARVEASWSADQRGPEPQLPQRRTPVVPRRADGSTSAA